VRRSTDACYRHRERSRLRICCARQPATCPSLHNRRARLSPLCLIRAGRQACLRRDALPPQPGCECLSTAGTERDGSEFLRTRCCAACPLSHLWLNVILNPALILGATLIPGASLQPQLVTELIVDEAITMIPLVPPAMNALCQARNRTVSREHKCTGPIGSGALAPDLARALHHAHRHPGLPGIWHDGSISGDARRLLRTRTLSSGFDRSSAGAKPIAAFWPQARLIPLTLRRTLPKRLGPSGRAGDARPTVHARLWREPQRPPPYCGTDGSGSGDHRQPRSRGLLPRGSDRRKEMISYKGFPVAPRRSKLFCWNIRR